MSNYWRNYQDFEPVVLTKTKSNNNHINNKSKTNIHINKPEINEDGDVIIKYYTQEQRNIIISARNAKNLSRKELAAKISNTLNEKFIEDIENGKAQFHQKTFNKIKSVLGIK